MNILQKKLLTVLLAGLAVVTVGMAGAGFAQTTPDATHAGHDHSADSAKWAEKMKERMAKHQAELHDKLKITASQEAAWKTFTDAMTPPNMPVHADRKAMDKLTTPERMEKNLQKMQERLTAMQTRLAALKTFYAVLTPEQQKVFDDSHRHMLSHMRERMAAHMGGHGAGMH